MELQELNAKLHNLYSRYEEVAGRGDLREALETGVEILDELLEFVKVCILGVITNPMVREVATRVLIEYERGLSFVKGAREAIRSAPPLYATGMLERTLRALDDYINGLFNFMMGALIVVADLTSYTPA